MMMLLLRPPAARCGSATGYRQSDGIERSGSFRAALVLLAPIPRACEGRADPATSVSSATHKQLDPRRRLGGGWPPSHFFARNSF